MAGPMDVKAEVEFVLKDQGITAAVGKVNQLEKELGQLRSRAVQTDSAFKGLGTTIGQYLGAAVVLQFTRTAVTEFAAVERSLNSLQREMESMGKAADFERVKDFLTGIEDAGDALLTQTVPAFRQFLGITQDVSKALDLVTMANTLADKGIGEFGQNVGLIAGIFTGRSTPAAKAFGLALNEANDYGKDGGVVMQQLADKVNLLSDGTRDAQDEVDKLAGLWAQFKRVTGELASTLLPALLVPLKGIAGILAAIGNFSQYVVKSLYELGRASATALNIKLLFTSPTQYLEGVQAAFSKYGEVAGTSFAEAWDKTLKQWDSIFNGPAGGGKVSGTGFNVAPEATEKDDSAKEAAERASAWRDVWIKAHRNLNQQWEELSKERIDKDEAALERHVEKVTGIWIKGKEDQAAANELASEMTREALQKIIDEETDASYRAEEARLAQVDLWLSNELSRYADNEAAKTRLLLWAEQKRLAIAEDAAKAREKLSRAAAATERLAILDAVSAFMELGTEVFGKKKAFAYAVALINTYRAVTAALSDEEVPPTVRYANAAAALAMGMLQVMRIKNTNLGSSGGGGSVGGGFKSGENFARTTGTGVSTGGSAPPYSQQSGTMGGPSTTYDNRTGMVVNFNGTVVGGKAGVAELYRMLDQEGRKQRSRLVR